MRGREERGQFPAAAVMQERHGVTKVARHGALVGDEADALADDGLGIVEENLEAGADAHGCRSTRAPERSSSACGMRWRMAERLSTAPFTLPGKFTTNAVPRMAACARESGAMGVFSSERRRISALRPGMVFSPTRFVASGVTSRGGMPVPPVVTTSRAPSPVAFSMAAAMASLLSAPIQTVP